MPADGGSWIADGIDYAARDSCPFCRMDRMDWTGVQVTLWQLSREKSLIAKRSEMKGNSGHTSKANFGSAFVSSNPFTPANQSGL
jgi:RNA polymerase subunit RPABC4/transcription elongation factor Spt4